MKGNFMNTNKEELFRITVDIPKREHKRLKTIAALTGKSLRELVIEGIGYVDLKCAESDHVPNEETRKAIEESRQGKNRVSGQEADKITKKFGL
jgi:hypothetical protein